MIIYFFILSIIYLPIKLMLVFLTNYFGKFTYENFNAVGFAYDKDKKFFYSTKNAWQREFGYCRTYDIASPLFQIIVDSEPVKFYYNNKNWLITFWKGQYGITTGAEIGIYSTKQTEINKKTLYLPIEKDEMLDMKFTLYKKDIKIAEAEEKHWWLAIFRMGMFTKPKDLTMYIEMTFPNEEMLNAFLKSFKRLKHKEKEYKVENNTFYFTYKKPKTRKVWTRMWLSDVIRQYINHKNVKLYDSYLADLFDDNDNKKRIELEKWVPNVLKNKDENLFLSDKVYSTYKKDSNE